MLATRKLVSPRDAELAALSMTSLRCGSGNSGTRRLFESANTGGELGDGSVSYEGGAGLGGSGVLEASETAFVKAGLGVVWWNAVDPSATRDAFCTASNETSGAAASLEGTGVFAPCRAA